MNANVNAENAIVEANAYRRNNSYYCRKCHCGSKCECGNNECKNYESTAKSGNIQTITFTTKSGQVLGCCTDEDITSIKIISSDGKMSIFNL